MEPFFSQQRFEGIWLPMITPMRRGHVDIEAICALERYYRHAGISGLVLFGSTGEGNLLSGTEKHEVVSALQREANCLPIMIGAGGIDTRSVAASVRRFERLNVAGYLVPPPYYLGPSQEGIIWHYLRIADVTDLPIVLYNIPKRTGVTIAMQTMQDLGRLPSFVAVKECDAAVLHDLNAWQGISALCGDDASFVDHFLEGGLGAIPAAAHVCPELFVKAMKLAKAGRSTQAREVFSLLKPMIQLLFQEPNPAPLKKVLAMQGLITDELRLPMTPASDELARELRHALETISSAGEAACNPVEPIDTHSRGNRLENQWRRLVIP